MKLLIYKEKAVHWTAFSYFFISVETNGGNSKKLNRNWLFSNVVMIAANCVVYL